MKTRIYTLVVILAAVALVMSAINGVAAAPGRQTTPPAGTSDGLGPLILEAPEADSYIVRLADGVSAEQAGLLALGGEVFEYPQVVPGFNFAVVRPAGDGQKQALEAMVSGVTALSTGILSVEPNGYMVIQGWPTDPMYVGGQQWGIYAGGFGMSFPKTGSTATIAVVDTGLAVPNTRPIVPKDDGLVVDPSGHEDLPPVPSSDRITVQNGRITYGSCTDSPGEGHGTHVTGIAAMLHNNGKGGVGVMAQTGRILCIKSFHGFSATWADIAWGLLYAGVEGAKFVNASWGSSGENELVTRALEFYLAQGDSYLIAACGNYGSWYPGCIFPANLAGKPGFERVISVGALNAGLNPASFSQHGGTVWTPGVDICSTLPPNGYGCWSGTSMATPYALGVIASMLERRPLAEGETLVQRLQACSLRLSWGGLFPRWECIGAAEEAYLPLIIK